MPGPGIRLDQLGRRVGIGSVKKRILGKGVALPEITT